MWLKSLSSSLCLWMSGFPSTVGQEAWPFSTDLLWCVCWKSVDRECKDLFLDPPFCFMGFCVCFNACTTLCFDYYSNEEAWCYSFVVLPQDCFGYFGSFVFPYKLRLLVWFLWKMPLKFWWGLHWICRLLLVVWKFEQYSSNPWTRFIFPLTVSSSISFQFCSFQCSGHWLYWLNLFLFFLVHLKIGLFS